MTKSRLKTTAEGITWLMHQDPRLLGHACTELWTCPILGGQWHRALAREVPGTYSPLGPYNQPSVLEAWMLGGQGRLLTSHHILLWSKPFPNPLQGHFSHEEGDGKIPPVPVSAFEEEKKQSRVRHPVLMTDTQTSLPLLVGLMSGGAGGSLGMAPSTPPFLAPRRLTAILSRFS